MNDPEPLYIDTITGRVWPRGPHGLVVPDIPQKFVRPDWAVCWDGVIGRPFHTHDDRDGVCFFCGHRI